MKVDTKLALPRADAPSLAAIAGQASDAEAGGYQGFWSAESAHDPFLPLVAAAGPTTDLELGTAISVAFARNPMSLAYTAHDMQSLAEGRFILGLGSQVRAHVQRRFGMPWSRPAARMHEFVAAMRAIWHSWDTGERLDFEGEFYSHTLMTPFFAPAPGPFGPPKVYLAAVGAHMTETAGAVCDGLLPHPFTTEPYLREETLPAVHRGRGRAGRTAEPFDVSLSGLVVCGRTEEEMATAARGVRDQIAFYASTPTYRGVLDKHGWGALGEELTTLSKSDDPQRWRVMGDLIDDEVLTTIAIVAEPSRLGPAIRERYGDLVTRFSFYAPYEHADDLWDEVVADLRAHAGAEPAVTGS